MREGHRELCPPDPNVPAAPWSSLGAHFLSASDTKSFCSTDLKLWRCLLHRLDLMQHKFCVNLNKILEVIRFLVMTVFLCHPVCDSAGFNALYYVLFCLFLSTCVLQSVCVHTMDFVSAHKQIKNAVWPFFSWHVHFDDSTQLVLHLQSVITKKKKGNCGVKQIIRTTNNKKKLRWLRKFAGRKAANE